MARIVGDRVPEDGGIEVLEPPSPALEGAPGFGLIEAVEET
jgi:hypothetical protein